MELRCGELERRLEAQDMGALQFELARKPQEEIREFATKFEAATLRARARSGPSSEECKAESMAITGAAGSYTHEALRGSMLLAFPKVVALRQHDSSTADCRNRNCNEQTFEAEEPSAVQEEDREEDVEPEAEAYVAEQRRDLDALVTQAAKKRT